MTEFLTLSGNINDLPITDGSVPLTTGLPTTGDAAAGNVVTIGDGAGQTAPVPTGIRAVAVGNMRIRSGPGDGFERIGNVDWGQEVNVLGRSADNFWLKIESNGVTGWSSLGWYEFISGSLEEVPVTN
jgi:hypothetical protein